MRDGDEWIGWDAAFFWNGEWGLEVGDWVWKEVDVVGLGNESQSIEKIFPPVPSLFISACPTQLSSAFQTLIIFVSLCSAQTGDSTVFCFLRSFTTRGQRDGWRFGPRVLEFQNCSSKSSARRVSKILVLFLGLHIHTLSHRSLILVVVVGSSIQPGGTVPKGRGSD